MILLRPLYDLEENTSKNKKKGFTIKVNIKCDKLNHCV